jgi:3-dehydroquinate synthase
MKTAGNEPTVLDVRVDPADRSYPVVVSPGLLGLLGTKLRELHRSGSTVALISDENVMALYGSVARDALEREEWEVLPLVVAPGEASKSPEVLLDLVDTMVVRGLTRQDAVVTLGGGVVGDLGGLAAALFMRGIPFVQCPTSLLAQVDASVGGKVAINLPSGKNLLGAFHFPVAVLIDPQVLSTLPDRELGCGLAEMLKHGALFSAEHFEDVVGSATAVYERRPMELARLVAASVALKAGCVSRDPREEATTEGGRILLNLGHTVGHSIEAASGYDLLHGEAVGLGLLAAARVSVARGIARRGLEGVLERALKRLRLPTDLERWLTGDRGDAVERALVSDKKRGAGTITYIGLEALGRPRVTKLRVDEILCLLRGEGAAC